jgi:hypothetical protein
MVVPLALTAVLALVLGVFPDAPFSFFELASNIADATYGTGSAVAGGGG